MPLSRRNRIIVIAATAVMGAAGLGAGSAYAASAVWHSGGPKAHATASRGPGHGFGGGYTGGGPGHADQPPAGGASDSTSPTADPSTAPGTSTTAPAAGTPTLAPTPGKTTPKAGATATKTPTTKPTTTAPAAPAQNPASNQAAIQGVFAQLNQLRATNGLPALALSNALLASTHAHNLLMINGCGLSHLCPGEAQLGDRIRAQGVSWTTCGENIGEGGRIDNNDAAITQAAEGQTTGMYNEVAPDNGHRMNILGAGYGHVGLDVVIDKNGIVWMTQDFTN